MNKYLECWNCKFWNGRWTPYQVDEKASREDDYGVNSREGNCRRFPPVYMGKHMDTLRQPRTHATDWCGEHQPKDKKEVTA